MQSVSYGAKSPEQRAAVDLDTPYSKVKHALNSVQSFAIYAFGCSAGEKNCLIEHLVEDNLDIRFTIFFALVYFHLF